MERAREFLRPAADANGALVRVLRITGMGLRNGDDGAVIVPNDRGGATVLGSVIGGFADSLISTQPRTERTIVEVAITDREAVDADLVCGGQATLLISPLSDLAPEAIAWFEASEPVVLVTRADGRGGELSVGPRGHVGSVGPDEAALSTARKVMRGGVSVAEIHEIEGTQLLFSAAVPRTRAVIVGSGSMADAFAAQGALMNWDVTITDEATPAIELCGTATAADALIVISHDPEVSTAVLAAGLDSAMGYIGAMGSRKTQSARSVRLKALGHDDLDRICGPLGLDLGSRTPAETAVAMAAEFLAVRQGRPPVRLSSHDGPIHS